MSNLHSIGQWEARKSLSSLWGKANFHPKNPSSDQSLKRTTAHDFVREQEHDWEPTSIPASSPPVIKFQFE